jgi:hypothetical protein
LGDASFSPPLPAENGTKDEVKATEAAKEEENSKEIGSNDDKEGDVAKDDKEYAKEEEDFVELFDRKEALKEFRILVQFLEEYLYKPFDLMENLRTGKESKVAFQNLWMLFNTGDTIYSRSQEGGLTLKNKTVDPTSLADVEEIHTTKRRDVPQAYRVLATAGGVPLTRTLASKKSNSSSKNLDSSRYSGSYRYPGSADCNHILGLHSSLDDLYSSSYLHSQGKAETNLENGEVTASYRMRNNYVPLYVYCFYIDFDGGKYGMVFDIFVFKPFDDEVEITSLDAFPLQFLCSNATDPVPEDRKAESKAVETGTESNIVEDELLKRGRKFMDLTQVTHMLYQGFTVGESREEVSRLHSPFRVDCSTDTTLIDQ